MIELLAPISTITISTPLPEIVRSCLLTPIAPEQEPEVQEIWLPTAPGITYNSLPEPPEIIDTSPDQIVGCIEDTGSNPQIRLNALFPTPLEGDGVVERLNNDIWVYRGSEWVNVGPTPGPTIAIEKVIPFWNEKVSTIASTKTFVSVLKYAYSLNLSTEVTLPTKTSLLAKFAKLVKLQNPVNVNIAAEVPAIPVNVLVNTTGISVGIEQIFVSSGSSSILPVSIVACESIIPVVSSGYTASIPGVSIFAEGLIAESIGYRVALQPGGINCSITATDATISSGKSIAIDTKDISIVENAPIVVGGGSLQPPAAGLSISVNTCSISTGVRLTCEAVTTEITGGIPNISTGSSLQAQETSIIVTPLDPELVGRFKTVIDTPSTGIQVTEAPPVVASGSSISVNTSNIAVAPVSPGISAAPASDPNFSSVSVLLHMDGSNGSTTITDNSSNARTITAFGNAQLTTSDKKYGTAALTVDGTGDYVMTPASTDFALGTGDFTVECWCKPTVVNSNDGLFTFGGLSSGLFLASFTSNWYLGTAGAGGTNMGAATAGVWQHIAVTRSGTSLRLFINGTQLGSTLTNSTNLTDNQLKIGYYYNSTFGFVGLIDELRVTKGIARYVSNFTAPTAPFPDS